MSLRLLVSSLGSLENSEMDIPMPGKPGPAPIGTLRATRRGTSCTLFGSYVSINLGGDREGGSGGANPSVGDIKGRVQVSVQLIGI
jgi:hypothetical protein